MSLKKRVESMGFEALTDSNALVVEHIDEINELRREGFMMKHVYEAFVKEYGVECSYVSFQNYVSRENKRLKQEGKK